MKLIVNSEIRKNYPDLRIGIVLAEKVENVDYSEALITSINKRFTTFSNTYSNVQELRAHKNINAWKDIYKSFGVKPKKHKPTAEAFLARVLKGFVPHINPAVDCYLMSETIHCLPIGGYDMERVNGDVVLRYSKGNEKFVGIGGHKEEFTDDGEIVYADDNGILTRRWNYKDCDACKIDAGSNTIALFVEGALRIIGDDEIQATIDDIAVNLQVLCNANTKTIFLDTDENVAQLTF